MATEKNPGKPSKWKVQYPVAYVVLRKGIFLMSEIVFLVEEDPEGGYAARALGESIFTQGVDMTELRQHILDAVRCHFDGRDDPPKVVRLHMVRDEVFAL